MGTPLTALLMTLAIAVVSAAPRVDDGRLKNEALEKAPDVDADRGRYDIACWDMTPGDVTVHHVLTLHGAPGNVSQDRRRRGLSLRFLGENVLHDLRPGMPQNQLDAIKTFAPHMKVGDSFSGDAFPLLWSAN